MQQNTPDGFNRMDSVVCLLAIENEMGVNSYGWNIYRKMLREIYGDTEDIINKKIEFFRNQIIHRHDRCFPPIVFDKNLLLYDGSHRIALSIFYNDTEIECKVNPVLDSIGITRGINWLGEHGFDELEIDCINDRCRGLIDSLKPRIAFILWPPVSGLFDEITDLIRNKGYKVENIKDVECDDTTFEKIVRVVYSADDVDDWKVEKKIEHMKDYCKKMRYFQIEFLYPHYRLKAMNGNLILKEIEELKDIIRNKYMNCIDNYFFDIVCHGADNLCQTELINRVFYPTFSFKELINYIENENRIDLKNNLIDNSSESTLFGGCIRIECDQSGFTVLNQITQRYLQGLEDDLYRIVENRENKKCTQYIIELNGNEAYRVLVSC